MGNRRGFLPEEPGFGKPDLDQVRRGAAMWPGGDKPDLVGGESSCPLRESGAWCFWRNMTGRLTNTKTGEVICLDPKSILGRSSHSLVRIPDETVSRRHAMISQENDGFWYLDLGSVNGSAINGARVTTSRKLVQGDRIQIGERQFEFSQEGVPPESGDTLSNVSTLHRVVAQDYVLLVSDIQGFARLSEKLIPDELAPIIGTWYRRTFDVLTHHGGNHDKFIGDCVLAYWTDISVESRLAALRAAGAIQHSVMETYRDHRDLLDELGLQFAVGCSVHLGRVAVGAMSSQQFTVIGDSVNIAFRVEALTRTLGEPVLTTGELFRGWPEGERYCRPLGPHRVKGRSSPVEIYSLESVPGGKG